MSDLSTSAIACHCLGKVGIVIVNLNGERLLRKCLLSILDRTDYPDYEVIFVDNGSSDASLDVVRDAYPSAHIIKNRINHGFAKANNQGIRVALSRGADFVLLVNNDVEVIAKDWLHLLVEFLASHREVGIVGCKLLFPDGRLQHAGGYLQVDGPHTYGFGQRDLGQYDNVREVDHVSAAAMMMKREVLLETGLLDEGYSPLYFEEAEFCLRARTMGFKTYYLPRPVLVHYGGETTKRQPLLAFYSFQKNRLRFQISHYPISWLVRTIPYHAATVLKAVFGRTNGGKQSTPWPLIVLFRAYFEDWRDLPRMIQSRRALGTVDGSSGLHRVESVSLIQLVGIP